jgi:hypothetical protein
MDEQATEHRNRDQITRALLIARAFGVVARKPPRRTGQAMRCVASLSA